MSQAPRAQPRLTGSGGGDRTARLRLGKKRVVVADDSELAAALIETLLQEDPSLQVVGRTGTGAELLELSTLPAADLVVVDMVMPELAGLSALSRLPHGCKAVAVSGDPEGSALARAALSQGARRYVSKRRLRGPQAAQNLLTAVHGALDSLGPTRPSSPSLPPSARTARGGRGLKTSTTGRASAATPQARPLGGRKRRVVIADDSKIATALLEDLLAGDQQLQVIGRAADGAQLLKHPALKAADVVLLDMVMPELAGLSVLSQLPDRCKVVAISGDSAHSAVARAALGEGAKQYISKRELRGAGGAQRLRDVVHAALISLRPASDQPAAAPPRSPRRAAPPGTPRGTPASVAAGSAETRPRIGPGGKRRVIVVDDSETTAALLEQLLRGDPQLEVIGRARNGSELLLLPALAAADVVVLDLVMPKLGGLSVLPQLVQHCAVVAVSSDRSDSALARAAMDQGAREFVSKQELRGPNGAQRLCAAVRAVAPGGAQSDAPVMLVAGSTGAVGPLTSLLCQLRDLELSTLVVQHLPPHRQHAFAQLISWKGIAAKLAEHGEQLATGVLVGPTGTHLTLGSTLRVRLLDAPPVGGFRPSATVLFESAIPFGERIIAVMFSGLGSDGAAAMGRLADNGGRCFAVDPCDCGAPFMPQAALAASRRVVACRASDLASTIRREAGRRCKSLDRVAAGGGAEAQAGS